MLLVIHRRPSPPSLQPLCSSSWLSGFLHTHLLASLLLFLSATHIFIYKYSPSALSSPFCLSSFNYKSRSSYLQSCKINMPLMVTSIMPVTVWYDDLTNTLILNVHHYWALNNYESGYLLWKTEIYCTFNMLSHRHKNILRQQLARLHLKIY